MQATADKLPTGIAPVFNGGAGADKFDYAAEITALWESFPETRETIYFVDLPSGRGLYPGSRVIEHGLNEWLREEEGLQHLIRKYRDVEKSSCCVKINDNKRCVLLYTQESPKSLWRRFMPLAQTTAFIFDHEVAHAIISDASAKVDPSLAECIADAYATIRHFQRYGTDTNVIEGMAAMRATRFVFANNGNDRGKTHFTTPVIEQLLERRHDVAWDKLTAQETADLARRFALMYAPHPIFLQRFDECFSACHTVKDTVPIGDARRLETLANILERETFPAFVRYGTMALNFCATEADAVPGMRQRRLRLEGRAERLANADEILSGLNTKARPEPQPRRRAVIANQP